MVIFGDAHRPRLLWGVPYCIYSSLGWNYSSALILRKSSETTAKLG